MTPDKLAQLLAKARAEKVVVPAPPKSAPLPTTKPLLEPSALAKSNAATIQLLAKLRADNAKKECVQEKKASLPEKKEISPKVSVATSEVSSRLHALLANRVVSGSHLPKVNKPDPTKASGMHGELIEYNAEQAQAVEYGASGKSFVLIGAAGTGKTTCSQGIIQALMTSGKIPIISDNGAHKHVKLNSSGILITAYTRRAVNNSRKVMSNELKGNCITIHKILEYAPVYHEIEDPETGSTYKTMEFLPSRNEENPLPAGIATIIIEEASMPSIELFLKLWVALSHRVQFIFIGDIEQLPPVFGSAILGYAMLTLPVVQLTQVYRQALESPIIRLAHRILSGRGIPETEFEEWNEAGKLKLHPWKKRLTKEDANATLSQYFAQAIDLGAYDPDEDMILIPFKKADTCGTVELNSHIANHLARKRGAKTYEIQAGFEKLYLSAGDKIIYDKEDAEVVSIEPNPAYAGSKVQAGSYNLDYWGYNPKAHEEYDNNSFGTDYDIDAILGVMSDDEERVTQGSHIVTILRSGAEQPTELTKSSELRNLEHSYAMTVHKAQGSEWRKVYIILHQSHATMLFRELLYTAVTRARESLHIICEPDSLMKGIKSQRIKGNSWKEKAEHFKGKVSDSADKTMAALASLTN